MKNSGRHAYLLCHVTGALIVGLFCVSWVVAADGVLESITATPEEQTKIESLIRQLGDESYDQREAAGEAIIELGLKALPFVEKAVKSDDFEIRYRSEQVRQKLRASDLARRLAAFEQDTTDETDYGIPGWNAFRASFGKFNGAKAMFIQMYRDDRELMELSLEESQKIKQAVSVRIFQFQQSQQDPNNKFPIGKIMALLYKGKVDGELVGGVNQFPLINLCYQPVFQETMGNEKTRDIAKAILTRRIIEADGWEFQQALQIALQHDIKEALAPAIKMVESRGSGQPHLLSQALSAVVRFGTVEHVELIEPLLSEKQTVIQFQRNNGPRREGQVGDMAMAAILKLTGKDPKDFGIELDGQNPGQPLNLYMIGFENETKRQATREKFQPFFTEWKSGRAKKDDKSGKSDDQQKPKADPPASKPEE